MKWQSFSISNVYKVHLIKPYIKWSFRLAERLRTKFPDATDTELEDLVGRRSDFASKCCSINSPPLYCDSEVRTFDPSVITAKYLKDLCAQIYSFLSCYWNAITWQSFPGAVITVLSLQWKKNDCFHVMLIWMQTEVVAKFTKF